MLDELTERRDERARRKHERLALQMRTDFIAAAMTRVEGREFFWWLLSLTGLNANPFTGNALATSFNCGQMNVGQQVQRAIIEAAPDLFLAMLKEQSDGRRTDTEPESESGPYVESGTE